MLFRFIHLFTRVPGLRIVAWHSSSQLRERDLASIRSELKVSHVLQGSVRRSGESIRIAVQLVDAETGDYVWSDSHDSEYRDILAVQEQIAKAIVSALRLRLGVKRTAAPTNPQAHTFCLWGRFYANKRTADGLRRSATYYEQAIEADGASASAHAGLADARPQQRRGALARLTPAQPGDRKSTRLNSSH